VIRSIFKKAELPFLIVLNNKEEAAYYLNDLEQMIGEQDVLFYPGSFRRPYEIEDTDNGMFASRRSVKPNQFRKKPAVIVVSYPEALFEKVVKGIDKTR
jgi:transcription-repair coupling factor (superfamily II helicase)